MKRWVKLTGRVRRHRILRKRLAGSKDKPRLSVYRSLKHIYAQVTDDETGNTLVALSTCSPALKGKAKNDSGNVKGASLLGEAVAAACREKGISKVVFDRSGYRYHGRVKALAETARKGGLEF